MADEKNLVPEDNQGDIVIYQTEDGATKIDVRFEGETVWLTQQQMAELFGSSRTNIVEHIPLRDCKLSLTSVRHFFGKLQPQKFVSLFLLLLIL